MSSLIHALFWGNASPNDQIGKNDNELKRLQRQCVDVIDALSRKLTPELNQEFDAVIDKRDEYSAYMLEQAFALGCGFAFQLMFESMQK